MDLVVLDGGENNWWDHANWAMARLIIPSNAKNKPTALDTYTPGPKYILTPPPPATPRINGPRLYGARPGRPFLYRVPATGDEPLTFSAAMLPAGLQMDGQTGIITGTTPGQGTYAVQITARNAKGVGTQTLSLRIGDTIALTPPLGWNSWNVWGTAVDAEKIKAAADAFVRLGLIKHGWTYINIDDGWEGKRDSMGLLNGNEHFPDLKGLTDYVHIKGLKIGLYSSPGPETCAGFAGSLGYEALDARTWADWGFDYLKYDFCTFPDKGFPRVPYQIMQDALKGVNRDIVYSICNYGMGEPWLWGSEVGGNSWRTKGDLGDVWAGIMGAGFQEGLEKYAGPGHWNDPDMLVIGMLGWGPKVRPTNLSPDEQYSHVTQWALLAAPLLIGCDLTQMDDFTLNLLTNDEVLAVNQDPLGKQARKIRETGRTAVWAKPLADGTWAVGLFNFGHRAGEVRVNWADLPHAGPQPVRDLWRQKDLGTHKDEFGVQVPAHGTVLVKIGKPRP